LVLLGISGTFLALSAFFLFKGSSTFTDNYYRGCVLCPPFDSAEAYLNQSKIFAIIGGLIGSVGALLVVTGNKEMEKKTGVVKGTSCMI